MLSNVEKLKTRLNEDRKKHEEKMCYSQALKSGCDRSFLECFDNRMYQYPLEQTKTFLELLEMEGHAKRKDSVKQHLEQWLIWLKVLVKEIPDHKEINNWKTAIDMIESTNI